MWYEEYAEHLPRFLMKEQIMQMEEICFNTHVQDPDSLLEYSPTKSPS